MKRRMDLGFALIVLGLFSMILLLGCTQTSPQPQQEDKSAAQTSKEKCSDGTLNGKCSSYKPFFCSDGELVPKPSECGCPSGSELKNGNCIQLEFCKDGTKVGECSKDKPFFCEKGILVEKASKCSCPEGRNVSGETCISRFMTGPKNESFMYVFEGEENWINITVYKGLNDFLANTSRFWYYEKGRFIVNEELEMRFMNNTESEEFLDELVEKIRKEAVSPDNQARIAISLVQNIPYDKVSYEADNVTNRYPYEVLYTHTGVCGEKSRLLTYLLKGLGYNSALFVFKDERHEAAGMRCPIEYSYRNTGYCFIESTVPDIITDAPTWNSSHEFYVVGGNGSFDSVKKEYEDAILWNSSYNKYHDGNISEEEFQKYAEMLISYGIMNGSDPDVQTYVKHWCGINGFPPCNGKCREGQKHVTDYGENYCTATEPLYLVEPYLLDSSTPSSFSINSPWSLVKRGKLDKAALLNWVSLWKEKEEWRGDFENSTSSFSEGIFEYYSRPKNVSTEKYYYLSLLELSFSNETNAKAFIQIIPVHTKLNAMHGIYNCINSTLLDSVTCRFGSSDKAYGSWLYDKFYDYIYVNAYADKGKVVVVESNDWEELDSVVRQAGKSPAGYKP